MNKRVIFYHPLANRDLINSLNQYQRNKVEDAKIEISKNPKAGTPINSFEDIPRSMASEILDSNVQIYEYKIEIIGLSIYYQYLPFTNGILIYHFLQRPMVD